MASSLPPINTLSLSHTGASPTTLVDGATLFNGKVSDLGTADSLTTASDGSSLLLSSGKPGLEVHRPEDATEVAGMHDRIRLKKHENVEAAAGQAGIVGNKVWMDLEREQLQAYEYLCHLGEAKE